MAWARDLAETLLSSLRDERLAKLGPAARGIVYQLEQGLGTALATAAHAQLRQIDPADRSRLGRAGIKLGRRVVYAVSLLRPEAVLVRATLCRAFLGPGVSLAPPPALARCFLPSDEIDDDTCLALGFPVFGGVAIRADEGVEAGGGAAGDQASAEGERFQALGPGGEAHVFHHHIDAALAGELANLGGNILLVVIDDVVGAEFARLGELGLAAGGSARRAFARLPSPRA